MKRRDNVTIILTLLFFVICSFLTVGYAFSDKILDLDGVVTVYETGELKIVSVELDTAEENTLPSNSGRGMILDESGNIALDYNFTVSRSEKTYYATYLITIENSSYETYNFTGFVIDPIINISGATENQAGARVTFEYVNTAASDLDLQENNVINPKETRHLAIKLSIYVASQTSNTTIGISGGADIATSTDNTGKFYGTVKTNKIDLQNNTIDCFTFEVLNTYTQAKTFSISSGNSNFIFVNRDGNSLESFSINAPSEDDPNNNTKEYEACVIASDTAIFENTFQSTSVILEANEISSFIIGNLDISVNLSEEKDEEKVEIGNVTFEPVQYDTSTGSLITKASWSRLDTGGTSVGNYFIQLYDSDSSSLIDTFTVPGDAVIGNYTLTLDSSFLSSNKTNMVTNNHSYYIKVYGVDEAGNSGLSDCSSDNKYCLASPSTSLKYEFDLNLSDSNNLVSLSNGSKSAKIYLNAEFTDTLSVSGNNVTLGSSVTVTMAGQTFTNGTEYFFGLNSGTSQEGTLTIYSNVITNDISVVATTTTIPCLVEGTKIRLANGTVKNIEDIKYDDLILALSHDTGEVVYEYPIWIEAAGQAEEYQITTFSDGSILKTVGSHGVYNVDLNEYVSVIDREKFDIGTRVIKINDNNEKEVVTVVNIEKIEEPVKYYHVSSTYYHNVIAENILTTDAILVVSNMFTFDDNLAWTEERENFINNNQLFVYEDWAHVFPEHIFKGFRMAEAMILQHKGLLDISIFDRVLNGRMVMPPTTDNGKFKWMVTTSDNVGTPESKFYEANSYYTLPEPIPVEGKTFKGWHNYGDNKYYMPGDQVEIIYSMYFNAEWK